VSDTTDRLLVAVNRTGVRSLEVPGSVTVDRSFTVDLRNHGEACHVHLHLDDALSRVARLGTANHHVPGGSRRPVPIHVSEPDSHEPVQGRLKVAIGYGQETRFVDVTVDVDEPVDIDPDLATPSANGGPTGATAGSTATNPPAGGGANGGLFGDRREPLRLFPAIVLGVIAVVLAAAAVLPGGTPDLRTGGFAVAAAVLAAGYLLLT
jgi:hypothetical protein